MVNQGARVLVFIPAPDSGLSQTFRANLMKVIPLFSNEIVFVEMSEEDAAPLLGTEASAPRVILYVNGTVWTHFSPPFSEMAILSMLNVIAFGPSSPVSTRKELYQALGYSYYSLLYPASDAILASNIQRFASVHAGFIDLVPFSRHHAAEMGLKPDSFYLFRLEDVSLVEVEKNETSVIQNLEPVFLSLKPSDLTRQNGLVFGISVSQLTLEISSVLESVALKYPNMTVGFINKPLIGTVNVSVGGTLEETPSIALFDPGKRAYYPIPHELNVLLKSGNCQEKILEFLDHLPEPIELSEDIPTSQDKFYSVLVGKTFNDFVDDGAFDSVVMFVTQDAKVIRRNMRIFNAVAKLFKSANIVNVRFGVINITTNSGHFPFMRAMPHIEIYPAKNKSNHRGFYSHLSRDNIIRFTKKYADNPVTIEVPDPLSSDLLTELVTLYAEAQYMPRGEVVKARERVEEIVPLLGINLTELDQRMKNELNLYFE